MLCGQKLREDIKHYMWLEKWSLSNSLYNIPQCRYAATCRLSNHSKNWQRINCATADQEFHKGQFRHASLSLITGIDRAKLDFIAKKCIFFCQNHNSA